MISASLLDLDAWAAILPLAADHLWQSTLFAAVAALLAVALRQNQARARHALWLAASVKFLVPFSILVSIGSQLGWTMAPAAPHAFSVLIEPVGEYFSPPDRGLVSQPGAPAGLPVKLNPLPLLLAGVWLCGCAAVVLSWCVRWRRVVAAMRGGVLLQAGRELEALRRVERIGATRARIRLVLSGTRVEPGVVGVLRPVLLWPAGISDRLSDAQIEAIIAHELCHVRRRDNLTSAVHMIVEAMFWFHPLVWWLGSKLVDERERACDEEVLHLGSEPEIYAESILRTCEFYLQSPLACVAGVSGSDLADRIERIMTQRVAQGVSLGRKLLLAAAGVGAVAVPISVGIANAPHGRAQAPFATAADGTLTFEVASIRPAAPQLGGKVFSGFGNNPGRFTATNVTVRDLLMHAYQVRTHQISGPSWLDADRYDIVAKPRDGAANGQVAVMVQNLLIERFKLTLRREKKETPVYALVVGKAGPKMERAVEGESAPEKHHGITIKDGSAPGLAHLEGYNTTLSRFAGMLSRIMDRPVVDQTEIEGSYNFAFEVSSAELRMKGGPKPPLSVEGKEDGGPAPDGDPGGPSLHAAIQKLGLKLEGRKVPLDFIIIEKGNRTPTEN